MQDDGSEAKFLSADNINEDQGFRERKSKMKGHSLIDSFPQDQVRKVMAE